ncbi:histidine phosphatase family protein [Thalassospira sp. GB04J01]|uniref:histidine phosphatase family protein n=1 Tax=Thalassospira sp. GB04J01 TaxID=1485225 RepID=UPI000C999597|nr:histidine phosphatase family protein [Thalassospira sp. GB04J01]|tara:strand:+ start:74771 stop:75745 length:975 start_codon:yes stop_codon:yes gene_type:complete
MTRELLILRHGKAKTPIGIADRDRPLKTTGKRQAQRVGAWLQDHALRPDVTVSSSAERAYVTAQKMLKAGGTHAHDIAVDDRIYNASVAALLNVLGTFPSAPNRVMIVGHNPGLEGLVHHLASLSLPGTDDGRLLKTGTLIHLSMPDDWRQLDRDCAKIVDYVRPDSLPVGFPYQTPNGREWRDRPAYYYTQSAVIPYRKTGRGIEILVITASSKNHWVVPKGIHEPGLSAQDSAAQEAQEEAGVQGRVHATAIGSYAYEKWGATCNVSVYPMEVTDELDPDIWEENHRQRRWVAPDVAAQQIKEDALKTIILDFAASLAKETP